MRNDAAVWSSFDAAQLRDFEGLVVPSFWRVELRALGMSLTSGSSQFSQVVPSSGVVGLPVTELLRGLSLPPGLVLELQAEPVSLLAAETVAPCLSWLGTCSFGGTRTQAWLCQSEAAERSGALNAARHAKDLGRLLMAVPGPVTSAQSAGCHQMIRDWHATLVTSPADVIQALGTTQPFPAS
jgi:hypothetical protein